MSAPPDAGARLLRLLALLAHLAEVGEASIADLARTFQMEEESVVADLELAACCGLPPYTPDQLLELVIDDGVVSAYGLDALRRPPRLTPDEGFALAASARALLAVAGDPGSGPLASALAKLESVLGSDQVRVELPGSRFLGELRASAASNEVVEIEYLGAQRNELTVRLVEPASVLVREGALYLDAWCHLAGDWRRFALERIRSVRPTHEHGLPRALPPELAGSRAFVGGSALRRAVLEVPPGAVGLLERVATGPGEVQADGSVRFEVEVADEWWFGRLLLRVGPDARVLEPDSLAKAATASARRALERYRTD